MRNLFRKFFKELNWQTLKLGWDIVYISGYNTVLVYQHRKTGEKREILDV